MAIIKITTRKDSKIQMLTLIFAFCCDTINDKGISYLYAGRILEGTFLNADEMKRRIIEMLRSISNPRRLKIIFDLVYTMFLKE